MAAAAWPGGAAAGSRLLAPEAFQDCAAGELRLTGAELSQLVAQLERSAPSGMRCRLVRVRPATAAAAARMQPRGPKAGGSNARLKTKLSMRRRRLPKSWFYDAAMVKRRDQAPCQPDWAAKRRGRPPGSGAQAAPAQRRGRPPASRMPALLGELVPPSPCDGPDIAAAGSLPPAPPPRPCSAMVLAQQPSEETLALRREVEMLRAASERLGKDVEAMRRTKKEPQKKPKREAQSLTEQQKAALQEKIDVLDSDQLHRALMLLEQEKRFAGLPEEAEEVELDIDSLPYRLQKRFLQFVDMEFKRRRRRR